MAPVVRGTAPISGGSVSKFDTAKRLQDRRGAPDGGSCSHDDLDPTKASSVAGGGVNQRQECDPLGPGVLREKEEHHGAKLLGEGLLCLDHRAGLGANPKLHSVPGEGR